MKKDNEITFDNKITFDVLYSGLKKPARREEKQSAYSSRENLLWNLILTEKNSPKKEDTRSRHSIYRQHKDQHSKNQQLEMERQVHEHNTEDITRIKKFPLTLGELSGCLDKHLFSSILKQSFF